MTNNEISIYIAVVSAYFLGYSTRGLYDKYKTRKSKCILPVVRKSVAKKKAKQPVKCPTCKFNKGEYCNVGEHKFYGLQSVICFEGEEYEKATVC